MIGMFFLLGSCTSAVGGPTPTPPPESAPTSRGSKIQVQDFQVEGNVDDAIGRVFFSENLELPPDPTSKLVVDHEPISLTLGYYRDIMARRLPTLRGVPLSKVSVYEVRYGIGEEVVDTLIEMRKKLGDRFIIITDLNRAMNYAFQNGEKFTMDFSGATFKDGNSARAIKRLLEAGFEIGKTIISPGIYDPSNIIPIMHLKGTLVLVDGKPVDYRDSTGNLTNRFRINRTLEINHPLLQDHFHQFIQNIIRDFKLGLKTEKVERPAPIRLNYPDGSFVESHFCSSRWNPYNDRIVEEHNKWLSNSGYNVEGVTYFQFLMSNTDYQRSLQDLMRGFPNMEVGGAFDNSFVREGSFGIAHTLEGITALTPYRSVLSVPHSVRMNREGLDRVHLYAYQEAAPGVMPAELTGAPDKQMVLHDKTLYYRVTDPDGKKWVLISSGSQNLSGNDVSLETLRIWWVPETSKTAQAFIQSITETILQRPESFVPMDIGSIRNALANFFQRSIYEISLETTIRFIDLVRKGKVMDLRDLMIQIDSIPSPIKVRASSEEIRLRTDRFSDVVNWLLSRADGRLRDPLNRMPLQRMRDLLSLTSGTGVLRESHIAQALRSLVYQKNRSIVDQNKMMLELASVAGIEGTISKTIERLQQTLTERSTAPRYERSIYDLDFSLFRLNTPIILFHKTAGTETQVPAETFAAERLNIGISGIYQDFLYDPLRSRREFLSPTNGAQLPIVEQFKEAFKNRTDFLGAAFDLFSAEIIQRQNNPNSKVIVVSDRGPSQTEGAIAFEWLAEQKIIPSPPDAVLWAGSSATNPKNLPMADFVRDQLISELDQAQAFYEATQPQYFPRIKYVDHAIDSINAFINLVSSLRREFGNRWNEVEIRAIHTNLRSNTLLEYLMDGDGQVQLISKTKIPSHLQGAVEFPSIKASIPVAIQEFEDWLPNLGSQPPAEDAFDAWAKRIGLNTNCRELLYGRSIP